jgi:hypothetical protein
LNPHCSVLPRAKLPAKLPDVLLRRRIRPSPQAMSDIGGSKMPSQEYTRSTGERRSYTIEYDQGEYFIHRDGQMKKSVPDALALGIAPHEATPDLMLRMAISDIEILNGMEE